MLELKQKGTVVEKLTEETLRDKGHLLELLAVCEGVELNLFILSLKVETARSCSTGLLLLCSLICSVPQLKDRLGRLP